MHGGQPFINFDVPEIGVHITKPYRQNFPPVAFADVAGHDSPDFGARGISIANFGRGPGKPERKGGWINWAGWPQRAPWAGSESDSVFTTPPLIGFIG